MMTRNQQKHAAQDLLIEGLRLALSRFGEESEGRAANEEEVQLVLAEGVRQFRRVEKLFGYEPGSHSPFI